MTSPPLCSAHDTNLKAPNFTLPENACDCHYHIFDHPSTQVMPRSYTAPPAPLSDLAHMHSTLGISRSVVVQPSVYGTDNRTTLSAISSTDTCKAIVVVDETAPLETLIELKQAGAVGCRVNLLFESNIQPANLKSLAKKASEIDWHLQLLIDVSTFVNLATIIKSLNVPVVFDHMGHMPAHKGINNKGFKQLLRLLGDGQAWVKLSGAYRLNSVEHADYSDVDTMVNALVQTNPNQLVWGSDWPHPQVPHTMPNDTDLLNLLSRWIPDTKTRNNILTENPEQLYGFERSRSKH